MTTADHRRPPFLRLLGSLLQLLIISPLCYLQQILPIDSNSSSPREPIQTYFSNPVPPRRCKQHVGGPIHSQRQLPLRPLSL